MARGWKDWVRGLAIWGVGPDDELRLIRTNEEGYLQVVQVPHAVTHQDGGSDEINVQGLSGVLRDLQRGKFSFVGNWADFPDPGEEDRLAFAVDRLTIYRDTGTSWQKVATAHWDYIEGQPSEYFPTPHAATHEEGGSDALTPANIGANWDKLVNKPSTFPPSSHAASHQNGGADEINVQGLSGELADYQKTTWAKIDGKPSCFDPCVHAASHENGGSDEINVNGLSGELADYQKTTWAKVDGKPSCFTPCDHKTTHQPGGSDALPTAAPAPITEGATGAEGSSTSFARADHVHETPDEWTPKEHGNEAHLPEMLPKDGSENMEGPIYGVSSGTVPQFGRMTLDTAVASETRIVIPQIMNWLAYATERGGSVSFGLAPSDGQAEDLFDGAGGRVRWLSPSLPFTIEIIFPSAANYLRIPYIVFTSRSQRATDFKVSLRRESDHTWDTIAEVSGFSETVWAYNWEGGATSYDRMRITISAIAGTVLRIDEIGILQSTSSYHDYVLRKAGGDMYGDIDMNGNDIVNPGLVDGVDVSSHASRHENGGADEINVDGLLGELADYQKTTWAKVDGKPSTFPPSSHASSHENGGADEINVNGLSGQLADYQRTTWSLVYNRPSTFPPSAHGSSHEVGGSDEVRAGKYSGVQVYNASAPETFTDLNLSSYIGSRRCLVMLKVKNNNSTTETFVEFRPNGDTDEPYVGHDFSGIWGASIEAGKVNAVWVVTDASGVVEWRVRLSASCTIWLIAYIPLS